MFTAENLKRPLWIAPGSMVNGVRQYGTPVLYRWNHRSLSSGVDMFAFGPGYKDYRRAVVPNAEVASVKQLDRVWIHAEPSDPTDPLARDADFYVHSAEPGPGGFAEVVFKRVSSDG